MYGMEFEDATGLTIESASDAAMKKFITEWAWETVPYLGDDMKEVYDDCELEVTIDGRSKIQV
jgi:hypothetical protein